MKKSNKISVRKKVFIYSLVFFFIILVVSFIFPPHFLVCDHTPGLRAACIGNIKSIELNCYVKYLEMLETGDKIQINPQESISNFFDLDEKNECWYCPATGKKYELCWIVINDEVVGFKILGHSHHEKHLTAEDEDFQDRYFFFEKSGR